MLNIISDAVAEILTSDQLIEFYLQETGSSSSSAVSNRLTNPFITNPHGHPSFSPVKLGAKGLVSNFCIGIYLIFMETNASKLEFRYDEIGFDSI